MQPSGSIRQDSSSRQTQSLLNAEEWLLQLDYSASKTIARSKSGRENAWRWSKEILIKFFRKCPRYGSAPPNEEKPTPGVEFKTPYGWVPLRQLGYGYRTMIAWIVDFASRMVERYPESPDPLAEPAVVLVDEIDLHLHPKWQRDLIGFLTERFPNTQFIATAHSPLIVQAAGDANIALLKREGDHVVIENNPETIRGWRVDQILTSDLFGLETARPPDTRKALAKAEGIADETPAHQGREERAQANRGQLGPITHRGFIPAGEDDGIDREFP